MNVLQVSIIIRHLFDHFTFFHYVKNVIRFGFNNLENYIDF